jgi:hypothetical protein
MHGALRPTGRMKVARGFEPLEGRAAHPSTLLFSSSSPRGRTSSLENLCLIELNPMSAQQFEEFRFEVHPLMMLFLPRDVCLDFGRSRLAYGETTVAFLPREVTDFMECLIDPF